MSQQTQSLGLSFFVKKYKAKEEKVPIYLRISVNRRVADISLKRWIAISAWNFKGGKIKGTTAEAKSLNLYLERVKAKIITYYQEMILQGESVSAEILKNKYLGIEISKSTICQLIEYHNNNCGLKKGSLKNYYTTATYVRRFLNFKQRKDMFLSELNYQFLVELKNFILNHPIDPGKPCTNNGVMNHMERLRKMGTLAVKLGWINKSPFELFNRIRHLLLVRL